jgi:sialidase-1
MLRRSTDGGKTWLPRQKIVHVEGELPMNPVAAAQNLDRLGDNTRQQPGRIVDHETGAVHLLYCLEYMRCFSRRSHDDGATWTESVEITKTCKDFRRDYDWKVLASGPAHGIQLSHGPHRGRWCRCGCHWARAGMLNSRSESPRDRRLVTISPDGATGWSRPRFDDLPIEPICMAGIVRVRQSEGDIPGLIAFPTQTICSGETAGTHRA